MGKKAMQCQLFSFNSATSLFTNTGQMPKLFLPSIFVCFFVVVEMSPLHIFFNILVHKTITIIHIYIQYPKYTYTLYNVGLCKVVSTCIYVQDLLVRFNIQTFLANKYVYKTG